MCPAGGEGRLPQPAAEGSGVGRHRAVPRDVPGPRHSRLPRGGERRREYLAAENGRLFDHVLVDEGQDLTPVRALVEPGPNEPVHCGGFPPAHLRAEGDPSHRGIETRGRSRRLTLNYRTTYQNLRWALGSLREPSTST